MENTFVNGKNILLIHYRVGKTDGVSLEMAAWKEIFEARGAEVKLLSGPENYGADFVVRDLESQLNPQIFTIDEDAFGGLKTFQSNAKLEKNIWEKVETIRTDLTEHLATYRPDFIVISNIFSVGENLPAVIALGDVLRELRIPTVVICHDFYWEEARYDWPTNSFIQRVLDDYFLIEDPLFSYLVINHIAQEALYKRRGIRAEVLNDTFDFNLPPISKSPKMAQLLEENNVDLDDILFLQATRIVRRKNIEVAIDFVREFNQQRDKLHGKRFYNGKMFDASKNKATLLLSGYAEFRDMQYFRKLLRYASRMGVEMHILRNMTNNSDHHEGVHALWDAYPFADVITYPSQYEGFGNQLLEAFFVKKPVVLFEYPVFISDIRTKGVHVVSLGDTKNNKSYGFAYVSKDKIKSAVDQVIELLLSRKKYQQVVEHNFNVGQKHFSYDIAWSVFEKVFAQLSERAAEVPFSD